MIMCPRPIPCLQGLQGTCQIMWHTPRRHHTEVSGLLNHGRTISAAQEHDEPLNCTGSASVCDIYSSNNGIIHGTRPGFICLL